MRLSGGERQRISLARAFLKDAPILILDEPTSSVDVKTEAVIMEAMERLMAGRTSFMIAHRLSTLDVLRSAARDRRRAGSSRARAGRTESAAQGRVRGNGASATRAGASSAGAPAVRAWLSLGGAKPRQVGDLKASKRSASPASTGSREPVPVART